MPVADLDSVRIKDLPTRIQPREILEQHGVEHVSEDVLLAVLLRTGKKGLNVMELAQALLKKYGTLARLASASTTELAREPGMGPVKAQCIKAALEMGRRMQQEARPEGYQIRSPRDVAQLMGSEIRAREREAVWVILLDAKNRVQGWPTPVSEGILDASLVHPREIFKEAVRSACAAVVVVHNHPSGDATPSAEDLRVTRQLVEAGRVMGIKVVDHVVLGTTRVGGEVGFVSIKEQGLVDF